MSYGQSALDLFSFIDLSANKFKYIKRLIFARNFSDEIFARFFGKNSFSTSGGTKRLD
jgi:hypothetical protein